MPITKTAKRALRSSKRKERINNILKEKLEIAIRFARKTKAKKDINKAVSYTDRAVKKRIIHKNKGSRLKFNLTKLSPKRKSVSKKS